MSEQRFGLGTEGSDLTPGVRDKRRCGSDTGELMNECHLSVYLTIVRREWDTFSNVLAGRYVEAPTCMQEDNWAGFTCLVIVRSN